MLEIIKKHHFNNFEAVFLLKEKIEDMIPKSANEKQLKSDSIKPDHWAWFKSVGVPPPR